MTKVLLDAGVAETLATLAMSSQLVSLTIDKYKTGKNKGKHFAEYTEGERTITVDSINVLNSIEIGLKQGQEYDIEIHMPKDKPMFVSIAGK